MTYYLHVPSEWHFQEAAAILQRIPSSRLYFLSLSVGLWNSQLVLWQRFAWNLSVIVRIVSRISLSLVAQLSGLGLSRRRVS